MSLPRVSWVFLRRDVVKGRLGGESLGTRRGQEGGITTRGTEQELPL